MKRGQRHRGVSINHLTIQEKQGSLLMRACDIRYARQRRLCALSQGKWHEVVCSLLPFTGRTEHEDHQSEFQELCTLHVDRRVRIEPHTRLVDLLRRVRACGPVMQQDGSSCHIASTPATSQPERKRSTPAPARGEARRCCPSRAIPMTTIHHPCTSRSSEATMGSAGR